MIRGFHPRPAAAQGPAVLAAILAAVLVLGGCASKPAAPEPTPEPATTTTTTTTTTSTTTTTTTTTIAPAAAPAVSRGEIDGLYKELNELRKKAYDLKIFEVMDEAYKAANATWLEAKAAYDAALASIAGGRDAPADAEGLRARDALLASRKAYQDLIEKGVVEVAAQRRRDAESLRETARKQGAPERAAGRFSPGEEALAAAVALVGQSRHEASIPGFERALLLFNLAYKRALAGTLRDRISERDFAKWDSGNFAIAEEKYAGEDRLFAGGSADAAAMASGGDYLDEAVLRYNLVIQKGRVSVAGAAKERSDASRARSDEIKTRVSAKEAYAAAVALHDEGLAAQASGELETAAEKFEAAAAAFQDAYAVAADKRRAAEAAMAAADAAAAESARKAQEADQTLSGAAATESDATSAASE